MKKMACFVLVLSLVFSFCGCGKKNAGQDKLTLRPGLYTVGKDIPPGVYAANSEDASKTAYVKLRSMAPGTEKAEMVVLGTGGASADVILEDGRTMEVIFADVTFRLLNTYMGVVLPFAVSSFAIYFFMQYAASLPRELVDAARVDGCGEFAIFIRIMGPLMLPAFGSMGILQAMTAWNDFLWPLIVMSTNQNFTLTVGLQTYLSPYGNNYNMLFAGAVISVIPLMIVFLCNQNAFISGIMAGSVKG